MMRPIARKSLHVDANTPGGEALEMLKALGNETRIGVLEKAGLLHTEMRPASRGLQKVCARTYDELVIDLPRGDHHTRSAVESTMPIGGYSDFSVEPTCGLASSEGIIGYLDDVNSFYEPDHIRAQLLWFRSGFVEYR